MSSLLSTLSSTFHSNRKLLLSSILIGYLGNKLYCLSNEKTSNSLYGSIIDHSIFPHFIVNKQGLWLYYREWRIEKSIGIIFIIHGYGEHSGRYEHLAKEFNDQGYDVFSLDQQGKYRNSSKISVALNSMFRNCSID